MGDQEEAPGSWLRIGVAPAVAAIWGVSQLKEGLSHSVSLSHSHCLTLSVKLKKKSTFLSCLVLGSILKISQNILMCFQSQVNHVYYTALL